MTSGSWAATRRRARQSGCGTDAGVISIAEVALASVMMLLILTATSLLLVQEETASVSQRSNVHAQSVASAEVAQLQSEAASSGDTFPPSDTDPGSTWTNDGSTVSPVRTAVYQGQTYSTYVLGGWCTLAGSATQVFPPNTYYTANWSTYTSSTSANPPTYWVAVIVTWSDTRTTTSLSVNSIWHPVLTSNGKASGDLLLLESALSGPSGTTPPDSSASCPAEIV